MLNFCFYYFLVQLTRPNYCSWDNRFIKANKMLQSGCRVLKRFIFLLFMLYLWICDSATIFTALLFSYAMACRRLCWCYFPKRLITSLKNEVPARSRKFWIYTLKPKLQVMTFCNGKQKKNSKVQSYTLLHMHSTIIPNQFAKEVVNLVNR